MDTIAIPLSRTEIDALAAVVAASLRDPKTTNAKARLYRAILNKLDHAP